MLPHNILEEMRFRAIEAHQAGKGVAEIAKLLGVHWGSVSRWLTKWRRDGERALKERKATGRPPKLDCKRHGKAILELVKHPATEYGYEHPLWTCQRIRQVISQRQFMRAVSGRDVCARLDGVPDGDGLRTRRIGNRLW